MFQRTFRTLNVCALAFALSGCMTAVGIFQPELGGSTIKIETRDADGVSRQRVLSPIDRDGQLFVAANHWPRAWFNRALANPEVSVTRNGKTSPYRAVPVSEQEREALLRDSGFPLVAYVFTGFAPRKFLRLDPL